MKSIQPNILGKEFDCINKIIKKLPTHNIGDDCAVLEFGGENLLVSVDTFSDKVHFDTKSFSLKEIGERCSEAAISDIAAMGGKPLYITISLAVPNNKIISGLTDGIKKSVNRHKVLIVGGDTTYSKILSISITVLGICNDPTYRHGARPGDTVYITGYTGLSAAGLYALKKNLKGSKTLKKKHKKPTARIKQGQALAKQATAMIDISDGLASELYHIAFQSKVNIEITKIPIHPILKIFCKEQKLDPKIFVLYGGEDYELLLTGAKTKLSTTQGLIEIGKVTGKSKKAQVYIKHKNKSVLLDPQKGFKHF